MTTSAPTPCAPRPSARSPSTRRQLAGRAGRGHARIEAARRTLEAERTAALAEVNAQIADAVPRPRAEQEAARGGRGPRARSSRPSPTSPAASSSWRPASGPIAAAVQRAVADDVIGAGVRLMHVAITCVLAAEEHIDQTALVGSGPRATRLWFGGIASIIVFALLFWKRRPLVKKAHGRPHRSGSRTSSTRSSSGEADAERRGGARSARRRATSTPSGRACWPRPTSRPRRCSPTVARRLEREVAELEAKADADIAVGRWVASQRRAARRDRPVVGGGRRARRRAVARRRGTQQRLIESFIATGRRRARSERMSNARIDGYARALFEVARAEGTLDEVEDELFRFARSYEGSDELRNAAHRRARSRPQAPGDRRGPARRQGHAAPPSS